MHEIFETTSLTIPKVKYPEINKDYSGTTVFYNDANKPYDEFFDPYYQLKVRVPDPEKLGETIIAPQAKEEFDRQQNISKQFFDDLGAAEPRLSLDALTRERQEPYKKGMSTHGRIIRKGNMEFQEVMQFNNNRLEVSYLGPDGQMVKIVAINTADRATFGEDVKEVTLMSWDLADDGTHIVYTVMINNNEDDNRTRIRNIKTGKDMVYRDEQGREQIEQVTDNRYRRNQVGSYKGQAGFYYSRQIMKDGKKLQTVYFHVFGTDQTKDVNIFNAEKPGQLQKFGPTKISRFRSLESYDLDDEVSYIMILDSQTGDLKKIISGIKAKSKYHLTILEDKLVLVDSSGSGLVRIVKFDPNNLDAIPKDPEQWDVAIPELKDEILQGVDVTPNGTILARYMTDAQAKLIEGSGSFSPIK